MTQDKEEKTEIVPDEEFAAADASEKVKKLKDEVDK